MMVCKLFTAYFFSTETGFLCSDWFGYLSNFLYKRPGKLLSSIKKLVTPCINMKNISILIKSESLTTVGPLHRYRKCSYSSVCSNNIVIYRYGQQLQKINIVTSLFSNNNVLYRTVPIKFCISTFVFSSLRNLLPVVCFLSQLCFSC